MRCRAGAFSPQAMFGWIVLTWLVLSGATPAVLAGEMDSPIPKNASQQATPDTQVKNGRVTIARAGVPLRDILEEIGKQTGATIDVTALDNRKSTEALRDVPLDRALAQLLGSQNFMAQFKAPGGDAAGPGTLVSLRVLSAGEAQAPISPKPVAHPDGLRLPQDVGPYGEFLSRKIDVGSDTALGRALGGRSPYVNNVLAVAFQGDAAARADATKALAAEFDRNAQRLRSQDDAGVAEMLSLLTSAAGPNAVSFLEALTSSLRDPTLRAQAAVMLAELQQK